MSETAPRLHFGGPTHRPRILRDLLERRIAAVPAGGEIAWATYYFRDMALAEALIAAAGRGVRVRLRLEGDPRIGDCNDAVIARLAAAGFGDRLRVHRSPSWLPGRMQSYLHAKLYVFSHPRPTAFVGSFNPSGNVPEDAAVIAEIGDQDRGYNLLAEFTDPRLVAGLHAHALRIGNASSRFRLRQNRALEADETAVYCYPRLRTGVIDAHLAALHPGSSVRGAISHLKDGGVVQTLVGAARRGAAVELIVHDTERRVPERTIATLRAAGIAIARYRHPDGLPLHAKFLLIDEAAARTAYFGSFNFNDRSRYINHELLVRSHHAAVLAALDACFAEIAGR